MDSPLAVALARVGDRWTLLVVDALLAGPRRFSELRAAVGGIAPNILSARLKHLEAEGLVLARSYSARPPRYAYELTGPGQRLAGALQLLAAWGAAHGAAQGPAHVLCGTPLETTWWCPTCEVPVADPDADELRHA